MTPSRARSSVNARRASGTQSSVLPQPDSAGHAAKSFEPAIWVIAGLMATTIGYGQLGVSSALVALLSVGLGLRGFWLNGGGMPVPSGVYMFSFAFFGGVAPLYGIASGEWGVSQWLWIALLLTYFSHSLVYFGFRLHTTSLSLVPVRGGCPMGAGLIVGSLMTLAGAASVSIAPYNPIPDALSFVGVLMVGASVILGARRPTLGPLLVLAGAGALHLAYTFNGFGRLSVVALGLSLLTLVSLRSSSRILKYVFLMLLPAGVLFLADSPRGLDSGISPVYTFADLLALGARSGFELGYGGTFLDAAVALVPRSLWPGKPIGFGSTLAWMFHPQYAVTGHSDVALFIGEWYYNFSYLGVALMIPVLALLLRRLDALFAKLVASSISRSSHLVKAVLAAILASGMMDLFWTGTFTFVARSGTRLLVALLVFLVLRSLEVSARAAPSSLR